MFFTHLYNEFLNLHFDFQKIFKQHLHTTTKLKNNETVYSIKGFTKKLRNKSYYICAYGFKGHIKEHYYFDKCFSFPFHDITEEIYILFSEDILSPKFILKGHQVPLSKIKNIITELIKLYDEQNYYKFKLLEWID